MIPDEEKKFSVTISRTVTEFLTVEVSADSEREAGSKVSDLAGNLNFRDGSSSEPTYNVESIVKL
jgi:hypothetical protein